MTISARFPGRCSRCGQRFEAGTQVEWNKQARTAAHADQALCQVARAAAVAQQVAATAVVGGAQRPIADFLRAARDRGLRFPKVRFLAPGNAEMVLSLSGSQSRVPGSVQVVVAGEWVGRIEPDGTVMGRLAYRAELLETLRRIGQDPVAAAREYGALMSHCSFCGQTLTDEGSVEVGYGPVCAAHYGLPHHPRGSRRLTQEVA